MNRPILLSSLVCLSLLSACEDNPRALRDADGGGDAPYDEGSDAPYDVGGDTPYDVGGDVPYDAGGDAPSDDAADALPDSPPDIGGETGPIDELLSRLRALPDVISAERGGGVVQVLIRQLIDHERPDAGTFSQLVSLYVSSADAPVVLATSGYQVGSDFCDLPIAGASCMVLEHRYFGVSIPSQTSYEWLTVAESAADTHHVIETLRAVFPGPWVTTGHSKGGMTAVYHRRFYPNDVVATVALVAPHSIADDPRYPVFLSQVHEAWCRQRIFNVQTEWFTRRARLLLRMTTTSSIPREYLYDDSVLSFDFTFFQYHSPDIECAGLPDQQSNDDTLFSLLAPDGRASLSDVYRAYYVQAARELGWPGGSRAFDQYLPPDRAPWQQVYLSGIDVTYDPKPLEDIGQWVKNDAERIIFIYGELDPWTAGAFDLGSNRKVYRFDVPGGNHESWIALLPDDDRVKAEALLDSWLAMPPRPATIGHRTTVGPDIERIRQNRRLLPL